MSELSFGEKAVGLTFDPSNDADVDKIKRLYATIIDLLEGMRNETTSGERKRHLSIAINLAEEAQMRAVKGVTWRD